MALYSSKRFGPKTELDSHANMPVVGKHVLVIRRHNVRCQVSSYNPTLGPNEHEVVDCAIRHDCPVTGDAIIGILYGALQVSQSEINLIPPFMLREAGWEVNDVPRIHCKEPCSIDHCLVSPEGKRIYMTLRGTFSGFESYAPSEQDVVAAFDEGRLVVMTPESWDPTCDIFEANEDSLTNYDGNVLEPKKTRIGLMASSSVVRQVSKSSSTKDDSHFLVVDEAARTLASISSVYDPVQMSRTAELREEFAEYCVSIGSCDVLHDSYMTLSACSAESKPMPNPITPVELSRVFNVDLPTAKATIRVTGQRVRRANIPSLVRNFSTNDRMLRYRRLRRDFYMDTFFAAKNSSDKWDGKSVRGFKSVQLFVSDTSYMYAVLMKTLEDVPEAVSRFLRDVGAPNVLIGDAHSSHQSLSVKRLLGRAGTKLRLLEEGTPWSNKAELYIGLLKGAVLKDMKRTNSPKVLWCYCVERRVRIHNVTSSKIPRLSQQTPHFDTFGEEPDISREAQFEWYEFCYFYDKSSSFPEQREVLGRVLGPAENAGNQMALWILKQNGEIVPRQTVRRLSAGELNSSVEEEKRKAFDVSIFNRYGDGIVAKQYPATNELEMAMESPDVVSETDIEPFSSVPDYEEQIDENGVAAEVSAYDSLISAELKTSIDGKMINGKVIGRVKDEDGTMVGQYDPNPLKNTAVYEVEFEDGQVKEYAANAIAEAIYSQCDAEGWRYTLLDSIVDYKMDEGAADSRFVYTKSGRRRLRQTTKGWSLKVRWKSGEEQWVPLRVMKESNPVETAEFACLHRIQHEPAFAWWVPYVIKKKKAIISSLKARKARKKTHKYGIQIPRTAKEAYELDRLNGNTMWGDAISKEMSNNAVGFTILEEDEPLPVGYTLQTGHMIFDVKMDLTRKARWVLDGHKTDDIEGSTYAGVVSRESVRIALTYAALHDLDVYAADIQNAYLQAPSSQKHYVICGPEFGLENQGKRALVIRALYGGKTAGKDFRDHLRSCMDKQLGYKSCLADPDVWFRPAQKSDGTEIYEYVLLYTDDCLVVSERAEHILRNEIGKHFTLKPESIGPPDIYLGGQMRKVKLSSGKYVWAFGSSKYVKASVDNIVAHLKKAGKSLPKRAKTPMSSNYRPELDTSHVCDPDEASDFQSFIGILRWMVELGRIDICCEVSMLSSHLAMPRQGHLEQVYHIFAYLRKHHNAELVFDPTYVNVDEKLFERQDWSSTPYISDEPEELPLNMPPPRGFGFIIRAFVDADHAGESVTRKSRSGFIVYVNNAPVYWLSKKQAGVETSSFGSEFTSMKQCCEYVRGLRYRLRMMGIPVLGCAFIYGDNQSVLYNTSLPDSALKKKSQSIAYHFVREGVARDEWRTAYINTHENPADLLTKPLSSEKRANLISMMLHHVSSYSYDDKE